MNSWITPEGKEYQEPVNMASSNMAADFFPLSGMMIGHPELTATPYPVTQDGDAAKIITRDTYGGYIAFMAVVLPKVTAGTLFNGTFDLDATAPLKSIPLRGSLPGNSSSRSLQIHIQIHAWNNVLQHGS